MYLYHLTVAEFLMLPSDPPHFSADGLGLLSKVHFAAAPIMFFLTLAVTGVLATLSWYLVEQPFLRRKGG
jgi:peptidoglycan/LPS O-acetylase OafA/YrhL